MRMSDAIASGGNVLSLCVRFCRLAVLLAEPIGSAIDWLHSDSIPSSL